MHRYLVTVAEPHPSTIGLTVQWNVNVDTKNEDTAEAYRTASKKLRRLAPRARPILAAYVRPLFSMV